MASGIWPVVNVQADAVAKDRYYENIYQDFDANILNDFVEKENNVYKITELFITKLRQNAEILLQDVMAHEKDVTTSGFSVYTGVAGVALVFLLASRRFSGEHKQIAKSFIKLAHSNPHRSRVNFLNGNSGVLILNALINDNIEAKELLNQRLEEMYRLVKSPNSDMPNELLYGRVGFLYSVLFMKKNNFSVHFSESNIKAVIKIIIDQGHSLAVDEKYKAPLKYKWHDKNYFGAAHGTAGILYLLLQAREFVSEEDLRHYIQPSIDDLLECRFRSGNVLSSEGSTSDRLVQWCHGAPGAVQLFCLAYEIFGERRYLSAAVLCGEVVWRRGLLRKGCGLCHGTAGNAYTFISLYQLFKKRQDEFSEVEAAKYLYRACVFADWCFEFNNHRERCPDRFYSLFEGLSGTIYFLIDLLQPMQAAFPGYTIQCL